MNALVVAAVLPCLGGLVLGGFGLLLLALSRRSRVSNTAREWPTLWGVVNSSTVREHIFYEKDSLALCVTYEPVVEYSYAIRNPGRTITQVSYGNATLTHEEAERIAALYPPGAPIAIHFNPENPGEEIVGPENLDPTLLPKAGFVLLLLSLLSVALGFGILFLPVLLDQ